jgi:hypothetical protein
MCLIHTDFIAGSSEFSLFLLVVIIKVPLPNSINNVTYFDFCGLDMKSFDVTCMNFGI